MMDQHEPFGPEGVFRVIALCVVVMMPGGVQANGGPVRWTDSTVGGGLSPVQNDDIRLVSEVLRLAVRSDGDTYEATASYVLENPSKPAKVLFGVPLYVNENSAYADKSPRSAQATARAVSIRIGDTNAPCRLAGAKWSPARSPNPPEPDDDSVAGTLQWCVAEITVPSGNNISLVLQYTGELFFTDWEFSKSALTTFGNRRLWYPFYPAGFWKGQVPSLRIDVDLGAYSEAKYVAALPLNGNPTKPTKTGALLSWVLKGVDLKNLGDLLLDIDATPFKRAYELARWNGKPSWNQGKRISARASSTLKQQGKTRYDPSRAVDGRPGSAWCEGKDGTGVGEWIELTLTGKHWDEGCSLEGIAIVPGYAKSQRTYSTNGRASRVRVSPCAKPNSGKTTRLLLAPSFQTAAVMMYSDDNGEPGTPQDAPIFSANGLFPDIDDDSAKERSLCLRITVLEVEPGTKYEDTCISEVAPVINCG